MQLSKSKRTKNTMRIYQSTPSTIQICVLQSSTQGQVYTAPVDWGLFIGWLRPLNKVHGRKELSSHILRPQIWGRLLQPRICGLRMYSCYSCSADAWLQWCREGRNSHWPPRHSLFLETEPAISEYITLQNSLLLGVPWQQKEAFRHLYQVQMQEGEVFGEQTVTVCGLAQGDIWRKWQE